LVKLENIQHLKTKFEGVLFKDKFFFDLINELQPTPAVCGFPKEEAYKFILENETYERGLYSGITGWFNLYDEGEMAVAIRSALIKGNKLHAFAGCGIVEGSDPVAEYEETEIKLKPIFSIFGYEN
jgi:menaquinone-specific isochorismate synthase